MDLTAIYINNCHDTLAPVSIYERYVAEAICPGYILRIYVGAMSICSYDICGLYLVTINHLIYKGDMLCLWDLTYGN